MTVIFLANVLLGLRLARISVLQTVFEELGKNPI